METAFEIFRKHWKNHKSDKELLLSTEDQNMIESAMEEYASQPQDQPSETVFRKVRVAERLPRFKMPTDKQLVDIAILFNQEAGTVDKIQMANMIAMTEFILYRLKENNDVMIPASIEKTTNPNT